MAVINFYKNNSNINSKNSLTNQLMPEKNFIFFSKFELTEILNEKPPTDAKLIKYLATVRANSYVGMVLDPTSNLMYGSDENINNIYLGFKSFLLRDSDG